MFSGLLFVSFQLPDCSLQQADYNEYCKELWFTITYNKYIDKRQNDSSIMLKDG